ncbi:tetratricopeptide repeat protein, partial [Dehalococcoidia bacterium]|nr:tetratricopeptide repeat protein [Dehalococcoidia bacterium]
MPQQIDELNQKIRRDQARLAISHAMASRWDSAVTANQEILGLFPDDTEALNRLGKALSELGRYSAATEAFSRALLSAPNNPIAKKNLDRIKHLGDDNPGNPLRPGVPPHFFIEETAKTGVTDLLDKAPKEILAKLTAGEPVSLEPSGHKLTVKNASGEKLGTIEPKLAGRLLGLMQGGNRYEAATTSLNHSEIRVIIKEIYQHPSQARRTSFLPKGQDKFRSYVWESSSPYGTDGDEEQNDSTLDALIEDGSLSPE